MTITDKFIELAIQIGNEVFDKAIDEPPVSAIIKGTLKRGGFGVYKIHKCPEDKPCEDDYYIVKTASGDITELEFYDGHFWARDHAYRHCDDFVKCWFEFD